MLLPPPIPTLFPYTTLFRSVTLTATPDPGSRLTGWSGACTGTGSCVLDMNSDKQVTATFDRNPQVRSEEHTSELQSPMYLVCRLLLEKKKNVKHPEILVKTV